MKNKLFVGNLNWSLRGAQLKEIFSEFWEVLFATVVLDRETKRSRGFWFVEFANEEDAQKAQEALNNKEIEWREIRIDFATEKEKTEEEA